MYSIQSVKNGLHKTITQQVKISLDDLAFVGNILRIAVHNLSPDRHMKNNATQLTHGETNKCAALQDANAKNITPLKKRPVTKQVCTASLYTASKCPVPI